MEKMNKGSSENNYEQGNVIEAIFNHNSSTSPEDFNVK